MENEFFNYGNAFYECKIKYVLFIVVVIEDVEKSGQAFYGLIQPKICLHLSVDKFLKMWEIFMLVLFSVEKSGYKWS